MDVSFEVCSEFLVLENILLMEMNRYKNLGSGYKQFVINRRVSPASLLAHLLVK